MTSGDWRIEWLDGGVSTAPASLREWWDQTFEATGNIWNCRTVVESWESTFALRRGLVPAICWASHSGGGGVIYPLYARRDRRIGVGRWLIEPMGGLDLCDYQDPLSSVEPGSAAAGTFWPALSTAIRKRFGFLSEFRAYRLLSPPPSGRSWRVTTTGVAPRVSLSDCSGIHEFLEGRSQKLRKYVSRRLRQFGGAAGLRVRRIGADELQPSLERFFERYAAEWGREGRPHALQDPANREWWAGLARAALSAGKLHFTVLERGGEDWHWHLGFSHRGSLLWYKLAYNVAVESYSPGILHLALLIDEAARSDISMIDLGSGGEEYKLRWSNEAAPLSSLYAGRAMWASRLIRHLGEGGRGRNRRADASKESAVR